MFPLCEAATLCPYFHQLLKDHYFKILVKLTASVDKGHMDLFLSRSQKSTMTTDSRIALVCMCCVSALREFSAAPCGRAPEGVLHAAESAKGSHTVGD